MWISVVTTRMTFVDPHMITPLVELIWLGLSFRLAPALAAVAAFGLLLCAPALEGLRRPNVWWATQLSFSQESGADPRFLVDMGRYDGIDVETVRGDAERYFRGDRYVSVVLLPRAGA